VSYQARRGGGKACQKGGDESSDAEGESEGLDAENSPRSNFCAFRGEHSSRWNFCAFAPGL